MHETGQNKAGFDNARGRGEVTPQTLYDVSRRIGHRRHNGDLGYSRDRAAIAYRHAFRDSTVRYVA